MIQTTKLNTLSEQETRPLPNIPFAITCNVRTSGAPLGYHWQEDCDELESEAFSFMEAQLTRNGVVPLNFSVICANLTIARYLYEVCAIAIQTHSHTHKHALFLEHRRADIADFQTNRA